MPTAKLYDTIIAHMDAMLYNPSRRYMTDADYITYIRTAITQWALKVGGLYLIVDQTLVADQGDYTIDRAHKKIRWAQYIVDLGQATETRTELDLITRRDRAYVEQQSSPSNSVDNLELSITGSPTTPKYLEHRKESSVVTLLDPPDAAETLRMGTISMPTAELDTLGATWEGEAEDVPGIAARACSLACMKSRDMGDAGVFKSEFQDLANDVRAMRSKSRRVTQLQDNQSRITRTRTIFGSRD